MNTDKAILIKNSSLYVNQNGELIATEDFKRFFPIDGMYSNNTGDIIIIDNILPYQYSKDGIQEYYQVVCETNKDADENDGAEITGDSQDKGINYYELEENEGFDQFIEEMDSSVKGCLYRLLAIIAIVFILLIIIYK